MAKDNREKKQASKTLKEKRREKKAKKISDSWLKEKNSREKGFSLGCFNSDYLMNFPVAVAFGAHPILHI